MALFERVREVYGLLAEGDFARSLQGARLALSSMPVLDGQPALALHEAIVDGLHDFLAELHESGLDLEAAWGVPRAEVDVDHCQPVGHQLARAAAAAP